MTTAPQPSLSCDVCDSRMKPLRLYQGWTLCPTCIKVGKRKTA